jgi:hypothetical protein
MSIIIIPADAEPSSVIARLAGVLADVLAFADHVGLPQPRYCTVSATGSVDLQFPSERASIDAVRLWAETYCAAMSSDPHQDDDGPEVWVRTRFEDDGVNVHVYAHVPVPETEPIARTCQDSDPATDLPF